ncbi:OLC1v1014841C3 [Oldenlandia corymbosa var. corymbosa]|uniref:OLC1v1014841C3 n=1 Tax=Oldenlandia corymbosa var. corymbosa TaxID=529605 RepID=A0AAV1E428_OLDCO|nr:OLC1v1014841C3 [Oldenlandia corymbosa var. corymbosa]
MEGSESSIDSINEAYRPLASLNLAFMFLWFVSAACWTINTYKNRHFQANKLQWTLAAVPLIKALQLTLSFIFWYSCFYLQVCSLWISFGVFVTGALFQTVTFVAFLVISHGYCITCERLSITERRTLASIGCIFYLTLVGYRASLPYFSVLLLLNYFITFYTIFRHVSQNLSLLREQLMIIEDEDVHAMHDAILTKYIMFKKFQGAMHIVAMAEFAIFINMDSSLENYWVRLVVREWAHLCIFAYVGWTFRSKDLAPRFSVMPTLKDKEKKMVPPIYRIEMDAATFKDFRSREWHIGVPTSPEKGRFQDSVLVVIQHPHVDRARMNSAAASTVPAVSTSNLANNPHLFSIEEQKELKKHRV